MFDNRSESEVSHFAVVEQYLERLETINREGASSDLFFDELLAGLIEHCEGVSAGVWIVENGQAECIKRSNRYEAALPEDVVVVEHGSNQRRVVHAPPAPRILASVPIDFISFLVIDFFGASTPNRIALTEQEEIIQGVADLAVHFALRLRLNETSRRYSDQQAINQLLSIPYRSESLDDNSQRMADVLLRTLQRDRVSVIQVTDSGSRLLALEPSANWTARSSQVEALCQLVPAVAHDGGWLSIRIGDGDEFPPRLKGLIDGYVRLSLARELWILSSRLRDNQSSRQSFSSQAIIVLEKFSLDDSSSTLNRDIVASYSLGESAHLVKKDRINREELLSVALDVLAKLVSERNRSWLYVLDQWRSSTAARRAGVSAALCGLVLCLLFLIPVRLEFSANGSLRPSTSRSVFATQDGLIEELYVTHGDKVAKGQQLLRIRNPELELELQKLTGKAETLQANLLSLRSAKINRGNDRTSDNAIRISSEEEDLKIQLLGIQKQLEIVKTDEASLTLRSPLDGTVDGWAMDVSLTQRPIRHGQKLFEVFAPEDGWQLDLEIPDDVAGYVLEMQEQAACKVTFRLRSDPAKRYHATLTSISPTTQINESQQAIIPAKVVLPDKLISVGRSGAKVTAQIDCGRSSLGFRWFREMIEFMQRSSWF